MARQVVTWSIANTDFASIGFYTAHINSSLGCKDTMNVEIKKSVSFWTGAVSTDWHNTANWSTGEIQGERTHVIIDTTNAVRKCIISSADAVAASVQVIAATVNTSLEINSGRKLLIKASCNSLPPGN